MSADPIDALIREIAAKHGVAVGRDDPIMILQTLNQRLLRQSSEAQEQALARHKEEMEAVAQRWTEDAKAKAERMLNAALAASKEAMQTAIEDAAKGAAAAVAEEGANAANQIRASVKAARGLTWAVLVAALLALLASAAALLNAVM